jgi:hypothetical protein
MPDPGMTAAHKRALLSRADLLAAESAIVSERHINWHGRLAEMGSYGKHDGGSAGDRRAVVEAMCALEMEVRYGR